MAISVLSSEVTGKLSSALCRAILRHKSPSACPRGVSSSMRGPRIYGLKLAGPSHEIEHDDEKDGKAIPWISSFSIWLCGGAANWA